VADHQAVGEDGEEEEEEEAAVAVVLVGVGVDEVVVGEEAVPFRQPTLILTLTLTACKWKI